MCFLVGSFVYYKTKQTCESSFIVHKPQFDLMQATPREIIMLKDDFFSAILLKLTKESIAAHENAVYMLYNRLK